MSGKQHRIARREAYSFATLKNFWSKCQNFMPKSLRFFAKLFRPARKKLSNKTAKLYRYNLNRLTQNVYDLRPGTRSYREALSFKRAQKKSAKALTRKRLSNATVVASGNIRLFDLADEYGISHSKAKKIAAQYDGELWTANSYTEIEKAFAETLRDRFKTITSPEPKPRRRFSWNFLKPTAKSSIASTSTQAK